MPAVKNNTNANIIDIIIATFIFLYCFAFIFLRIANFIVRIWELNLKIKLNTIIYIRDWRIPNKIIEPNIINKNIVLNNNTCRSYWPSSIANGIQ